MGAFTRKISILIWRQNWHYAVVIFEGPAIGLYIDGVPVATKSATASQNSGGEETIRMRAD